MTTWERIKARVSTLTTTEKLLCFFNGVLAAIAILQFLVLSGQLNTMRKDQRPWIRVDLDGSYVQLNSAMFAVIHLLNKGKTPARGVYADLFVERVKIGEEPLLDSVGGHERVRQGIQFPDIASGFIPVNRVLSRKAGQTDPNPVTDSEFKEWSSGASYFVVYGKVIYTDYYNVGHWTKFCVPLVAPKPPTSGQNEPRFIPFRKCTEYGDVDGS